MGNFARRALVFTSTCLLFTASTGTATAQISNGAELPASSNNPVVRSVEQRDTCTQKSAEAKSEKQKVLDAAQKEYETFDLEAEIAKDPARYQDNLSIIENSSGLVEYFNKYSDFPEEDKQRLAASTPTVVVQEMATNLEGKSLLINPSTGFVEVVPQEESDKYDNSPTLQNNPCWKSYVGAGTAALVSGFYCGLGGPIVATACTVGVAIGGTHVDWNKHC